MKEMKEKNPLRDKIENEVIYKYFTANVPLAVYTEQFEVVDSFCKENFMDNRWSMIWNLVIDAIEDYKYKMLFDEMTSIKAEIESIKTKEVQPEIKPSKLKTFGNKE